MADSNSLLNISAKELKEKMDRDENLLFFDVRPRENFSQWAIETKNDSSLINVPYREMVAEGGQPDPIDSMAAYFQTHFGEQISQDREVITVCAKGISSEDLTAALTKLGYPAKTLVGGMGAWGEFYDIKSVVESESFSLYQINRPARGCLSYIISSNGMAAVVDPLRHIDPILEFTEQKGLKIELVLETHGHADHISGGRELADRVGAPYYLHPYDAIHPIDVLPADLSFEYIADGQVFSVGDVQLKTIHVPGHTLGNVAYLVGDDYLLSGDSIFMTSISRPDLGGQAETWAPIHFRSLKRLLELGDETIVLPGHFSHVSEINVNGIFAAPLGDLKASNKGLAKVREGEAAFVSYILESLPEFPEQYIDIKRVNAGLLKPDEAKAGELELGRNICALS
jgi:glyoxylase-like metal-dependent hydrolase (beta-lactamase superfamily II)/rhodanese-related sulfurtransferase